MNNIFIKTLQQREINFAEVKRYAGNKTNTENVIFNTLINECVNELENHILKTVCYSFVPVKAHQDRVDFSFCSASSKSLAKALDGCSEAIIFATTIGLEIDRLITKYSKTALTKALIFQALGTERIESLCDSFIEELSLELAPKKLKLRFSPGYGDLSLDFQKEIFSLLECPKRLGLCLNDSLIMSPSKSVTAIVGITDKQCTNNKKCENCNLDCSFRSFNENS